VVAGAHVGGWTPTVPDRRIRTRTQKLASMTWSRRLPDVSVSSSPPEMTDVALSMSWTSAKEPTGRAIVHFVRLSIFEWGVRLGPAARVLGLIAPTLEFRFEEIRSADVVRGSRPFRGPGSGFESQTRTSSPFSGPVVTL